MRSQADTATTRRLVGQQVASGSTARVRMPCRRHSVDTRKRLAGERIGTDFRWTPTSVRAIIRSRSKGPGQIRTSRDTDQAACAFCVHQPPRLRAKVAALRSDRRRSWQCMIAPRWDTERLAFQRLPGEVYPQFAFIKNARGAFAKEDAPPDILGGAHIGRITGRSLSSGTRGRRRVLSSWRLHCDGSSCHARGTDRKGRTVVWSPH